MKSSILLLISVISVAVGCAGDGRLFALHDPYVVDTDLRSVWVPCRKAPIDKDPKHVDCAPIEYVSPLVWDGADNLVFRPLSEAWAFEAPREAMNVNSLDELPDSAWFTNRTGAAAISVDRVTRGACSPDQMLDADRAPDGSWLVDRGKTDGSSPGFRINVAGRKYLLKVDADAPERASAASTVGAAIYSAVGFNTSCEQIVYAKRSVFALKPGLRYKGNFDGLRDFDQAAFDRIVAQAVTLGDRVRFQASAWLPGKLLGPFRYEGTRQDDPNDIVPHEHRRELRGGRVLAAWIDHFDAREQNSMDVWQSDGRELADASPGRVIHYYLDTSDVFGSAWAWEQITRRLGHSYVFDWSDLGRDFVTLGLPLRPWDRVERAAGHEIFNYFDVATFDPDGWKNEYANPAFDRMTERDAAWMARILARFTPEAVGALASMAKFSDPSNTAYLDQVLEGRLRKILERYLTRLSPISAVHLEGTTLCATDLAALRGLRDPSAFHYGAADSAGRSLPVARRDDATFCLPLTHSSPDGGVPDGDPSRYVRVVMVDGVARGALVAHAYDLGPSRGFRLVGLERTAATR